MIKGKIDRKFYYPIRNALGDVVDIADTIGNVTGYNYLSDGLFQGTQIAYNWYAGMMEGIAAIGSTGLGLFI